MGVFLWNVVFSLKDPKWTSPSFLSCILCWVVSSSWHIDPNNLRLDLHTGPQERQRTWRGKKRVNCSSYWKFTEGQMKTWMEQEEEERPMICRQKQEKRSVKMVVQDLPRQTEQNPRSQVQTIFLILTHVSATSCKIPCLHSFCKYSWAVLAAITQPPHKHKSSFEFWKCTAQFFGFSWYHRELFAARQLALQTFVREHNFLI